MKYFCQLGDERREFSFVRRDGVLCCRSQDREWPVDLSLVGDGANFSMLMDGLSHDVVAEVEQGSVTVQLHGERFVVKVEDEREQAAHAAADKKGHGRRELRALMPGIVVDVQVAVGDVVEEGQTLVVLEAMKMQNPLAAEGAGTVAKIHVQKGDAVAGGALLVEIVA